MSNYCDTKIGFICDKSDIKELKKLYDVFNEFYGKYGFGEYIPLDEIASFHNLDYCIMPCDGEICYVGDYDEDDTHFRITTITNWKPIIQLWDKVVKQYTGIQYVYKAETQNGDMFINTDSEGVCFPERYVIYASITESSYNELPLEYFTDKITFQEFIEERYSFNNFNELQNFMSEITDKIFDTISDMNIYFQKAMVEYDKDNNSCSESIIKIHEYSLSYKED